jgi:hypothetical protein
MKTYGVWRYRSTIRDQLHIWATLTPGKEAVAPIGEEVGWTQSRSGRCGVKQIILHFPGMEPRPSRNPSLHRLSYPNLPYTCERASVLHVVRYTHWFWGRGSHNCSCNKYLLRFMSLIMNVFTEDL